MAEGGGEAPLPDQGRGRGVRNPSGPGQPGEIRPGGEGKDALIKELLEQNRRMTEMLERQHKEGQKFQTEQNTAFTTSLSSLVNRLEPAKKS